MEKDVSIQTYHEATEFMQIEERRRLNAIRESIDRCREMFAHPIEWQLYTVKPPVS